MAIIQKAVIQKKGVLVLVLLSLMLSFASAASFDVNISAVKDKITIREQAEFNIKVTNLDEVSRNYRIFSLHFPEWDMYTQPLISPIELKIWPGESEDIKVYVDPISVAMVGTYVNVQKDKTTEIARTPIKVSIFPKGAVIGGYVPNVIAKLTMPDEVDPRDKIPISIKLENQNMLDIENMTLIINSDIIKKQIYQNIGPKGTKTLELEESIGHLTPPGSYSIVLTVYVGDDPIITPVGKSLKVKQYAGIIDEKTEKSFLKATRKITFGSNNEELQEPFKIETKWISNLFTSKKPRASTVKEGKKLYIAWQPQLDPETKTMQVTVSENYRTLFIILFLIIAMILFYFSYRSPLTINKKAASIGRKEGGISEIKVVLQIKNRGKEPITEIHVKDRIPHLTDIEKEITIGTLQPTNVLKHETKGTFIKWVVDRLEPNEERVINYKVKSRLSILGDFSLPPTYAAFVYGGKQMKTSSNRLSISS